ncbi:uncharacterized protein N0V89_007055 [Didymosphaeria variabile]|uniref:Uncharacterized protein n=1 Tax=Didymosphaeria variabile TaxID=1932322 RepID=A0A9W8XIT1_9PLEO|nr:uncharacterized protein N0V89_007055 [Didymosphaeria variabile]KAJ4351712.1 hypothetical protein N0V89_007055 [Didymosphaeria variabile]
MPPMPDLSHVSAHLEGVADQLRRQFGGPGGGRRPGRTTGAVPAAAIAQVHDRISDLAHQVEMIRNDINTRLSRLEASDWNQRVRRINLGRPNNNTRLAPLSHHLTNTAIPGFPQDDQECFNLSDLEVQRILHSLGHAGHDVHARRILLENIVGVKEK